MKQIKPWHIWTTLAVAAVLAFTYVRPLVTLIVLAIVLFGWIYNEGPISWRLWMRILGFLILIVLAVLYYEPKMV